MNLNDKIVARLRSWLHIDHQAPTDLYITEYLDFNANAARNRVWYRGEGSELSEFYKSYLSDADTTAFWKSVPTKGLDFQKRHIGIPTLMIDTLTSITMADMNAIELDENQITWEEIAEDNNFNDVLEDAVKDSLLVGDGAFKISIDTDITSQPMVEFVPGDRVEYNRMNGRVIEVIFKTPYYVKNVEYVLKEIYGKGYIYYELYKGDRQVELFEVPYLANLQNVTFDGNFIMAVPFKIFKSNKWAGRGKSIFDTKTDAFDSLDECWSTWMDAIRKGKTIRYIPESLLPRDPNTGAVLRPNGFDNAYIKTDSPISEGNNPQITVQTTNIPSDNYIQNYITSLDLCLQGVISPSTLGIDTKKLDNAEAQREKEKTTLYTRNKIVDAIQNIVPEVVNALMKVQALMQGAELKDYEVSITFGEYANPSFEAQVETVGKARQQGIMSVETAVDELYGDTKDDEWKKAEVKRIKEEQGISEMEEPTVNMELGDFSTDLEE